MSSLNDMVREVAIAATRKFAKQKQRAAARSRDYLSQRDIAWLRNEAKREQRDLIKTASYQVMKQAYDLVSDYGSLPANARQIMYAARPLVLEITHGKIWKNSAYFTQTLLPDFQEDHPELTAEWDVVYDARGHLVEPHMKRNLGLGTLEVRSYVGSWRDTIEPAKIESVAINLGETTSGPTNRFRYALFIEKEGFDALLQRSRIAERYDLAIFSSKGMSTTATRMLVDELAGASVTILILHDFDLPGLTIAHTLVRSTDRYWFQNDPEVIDLGLRLHDVATMNLESEPVEYQQTKDPRDKFREQDYNASQEELDYLVEKQELSDRRSGPLGAVKWRWVGKRVELNAMTSRQFVDWLEAKLKEHGVKKIVPDQETLTVAWHNARRRQRVNQALKKVLRRAPKEDATPLPADLEARLRNYLEKHPATPWDDALAEMVAEEEPKS